MEQIRISGLSFSYPGASRPALEEIGLTVEKGDFVLLFGRSGCGKTTLLKLLKPAVAPFGKRTGAIRFCGKELGALSLREQSERIGFVSQDPDNQIVTDKVWHELAFGLESLGCESKTIRLRVAEMAFFFGIQNWFFRPVTDLSDGQRQILCLASVMVMQPEVLLLDEPTSRLDPIAASNFVQMLRKINEELGVTVVISEHRLEEVLPVCSRAVFLEDGRVAADTAPEKIGAAMKRLNSDMAAALPACVRICAAFEDGETPVTAKGARRWLEEHVRAGKAPESAASAGRTRVGGEAGDDPAAVLEDVWFRYDKNSEDILRGASLKIGRGVLYAVLGGNGVGKSTLLSVLGGVNRPYRGKTMLFGRNLDAVDRRERYRGLIGYLPQEPRNLFRRSTVRKDLEDMAAEVSPDGAAAEARLQKLTDFFRLQPLLERHPFDLSGGELQCAALAKVLLTEPKLLLLDEPTKGIDAAFKDRLAGLLAALRKKGTTVVMVSHDVDFCAGCADRCALMFQGGIVSEGPAEEFFAGNSFYTTSANRIARGFFPGALTCEDVIESCRKNMAGT